MVTAFWSDKRVLVTGHTGFKGAWLALWLRRLGAQVTGLALEPDADSLYAHAGVQVDVGSVIDDVRNAAAVRWALETYRPQIVFHLAAQALVRKSYVDPLTTFETNVQGTANVLDAVRSCSDVRVVIVATTDKVYANRETSAPYVESDALGGHDPYSASKAAAELVVASYRDSFLSAQGVALSTVRAGNVIGGGDWSADRLIPDAVRAWLQGACLVVRNPSAVRPWQHVLEPLGGYLELARIAWSTPSLAGAYNFGPDPAGAATVSRVIALAQGAYGKGLWRCEPQPDAAHEAQHLTLDAARARKMLGVRARWTLEQSVTRTMLWYRQVAAGGSPRAACIADLDAYEAAA
jgi:CDP-glucose 4,6-dehydratase